MESRVQKFLENKSSEIGLSEGFSLARLDSGESNETFEVKGDENLIVRTSKEDSPDRIAHEKEVLKFLEQEGIENTPRLVYYSEETSVGQPIIVETFVGEEELNMEEASAEQIENLAEILAEIHSISVESYNEFFEIQKPISVSLNEELEKDFRNYSRKPYQEYISLADKADDRVKNFYCRQKELLEEVDQEVEVPWTFVNGDIPNNLRHTGDEVYLVDWELSGVGVPYIELIEFFTSGEISEEIQQTLMENYEQIYDLPKDWRENAGIIEKFHGFNSMIWAAKKKEQRNEKKYEEIFEKRMEHLENLYGE